MSQNLIQLVHEDKSFNDSLKRFFQKNIENLAEKGFNYRVVSVFGSQSSGKSTLLNRLFHTDFEVMEESQRKQTTRGIWLSYVPQSDTLVFDVEGTDGRERGEDQDFERKSALFSLAVSQVLIINMWENMVGLYQGANMGLLKTVFEVNSQLFQSLDSPKTLLLFCVRDFTGKTPAANLENVLLADLKRMWESVSKPEAISKEPFQTFFKTEFAFLPHKIYAENEFNAACKQLSARLTKDDLFSADLSKQIPLDGFSKYAADVWDTVLHNRDLDLPTQQQLLAQFRCDEISRGVLSDFTKRHESQFKAKLERGEVIRSLGQDMSTLRKAVLTDFDAAASRYNAEVFQKKRQDILDTVNRALGIYFIEQIRNLVRVARGEWVRKVSDRLKDSPFEFSNITETETRLIMSNFTVIASAVVLPGTDWSYEEQQAQFTADLEGLKKEQRVHCIRMLLVYTEKNKVSPTLDACIDSFFSNGCKSLPQETFWDQLYGLFQKVLSSAAVELVETLKEGFGASDDEVTVLKAQFEAVAAWHLRRRLAVELGDTTTMVARLRRAFEDVFRFDEHGVPRFWNDSTEMDSLFEQAKAESENLLKLLSKITFPAERVSLLLETLQKIASSTSEPRFVEWSLVGDDVDSSSYTNVDSFLTLIPSSKYLLIWNQLQRDISLLYVEAKQSLVAQPPAKIPNWLVGLLLVLGWNEIVAVLSSPVYFISLVLVAFCAYVVYKTGMAMPLYHVAATAVGQAWYQLRIVLTIPQPIDAPAAGGSAQSENRPQPKDSVSKKKATIEKED